MYKLLLCWRYLLTRYLAFACIISVMLGVATLIVVNSVMSGFSTKLKDRLHGLLSDVVIEGGTFDGFADPDEKMRRIKASPIGDKIACMTPVMEVFAMFQFQYHGETVTRSVRLIGVEPISRTEAGGFSEYLLHQKGSTHPSFELSHELLQRLELKSHRPDVHVTDVGSLDPNEPPPPEPPPSKMKVPVGIIVGNAIASYRDRGKEPGEPTVDRYVLEPGDEVIVTTVSGQRLAPVYDRFAVCDYFKSEMSEYDSNYVFVPLDYLQKLRTMENRVTSIQIKLKDYSQARQVLGELRKMFPESSYMVSTWEEKQGALLGAIDIERGILNVLLFLIIGVAGFGILSIFAMIVVEKTRDIGILKALGASKAGIAQIFVCYGALLGIVGAIFGTGLGVALTIYINEVEHFLSKVSGHQVFDRTVYYFDSIPTDLQTMSVVLVNVGAIGIAVLFSVLPALRAASLHPVRALRYE